MNDARSTHSIWLGYLLWIFGFIGAHRFFYGKKITGVIWFFTLGLLFVGWLIDLFLIPSMAKDADRRYVDGPTDYNLTWILLTFLGVFGAHRFYMGKIWTGLLYLLSSGLVASFTFPFAGIILFVGILYDFLTLNEQLSRLND